MFTGAYGLDAAVHAVFGGVPAWVCESDPAATTVLTHRVPGVPNLGDVTAARWPQVPAVDVICGGYPCQPASIAGLRRGTDDERWLWPAMLDAVRALRPGLVVGENVRHHLRIGFATVVADLQAAGYAVAWGVVAASDVGAPHRRERLFWIAWPETAGAPARLGVAFAELGRGGWEEIDLLGGTAPEWPVAGAAYAGAAYAGAEPRIDTSLLRTPTAQLAVNGGSQHPDKRRHGGHGPTLADEIEHLLPTPTAVPYGHQQSTSPGAAIRPSLETLASSGALLPTPRASDSHGIGAHGNGGADLRTTIAELLPTPTAADSDRTSLDYPRGVKGGPNQRGSSGDLALPAAVQPERWGQFAAAVARWEALTRPAPDPTQPGRHGKPRLSPAFCEWLMGWPDGWVTDVPGITRTDAIRMCGNGVVTQQADAALRWLARSLPQSQTAGEVAS